MPLYFMTDTHLGLVRNSHTTPESRRRLQSALYSRALQTAENLSVEGPLFHLGDLLDTASNDEVVIADTLQLMPYFTRVMAGNHDLANRQDKMSSFELIDHVLDTMDESYRIVRARVDQSGFDHWSDGEHLVVMVPHHGTQELFLGALTAAEDFINMDQGKHRHKLLLLHCNYDLGYEMTDSTLNLPREVASGLLQSFDYILLGHEHMPRADFDGRLQILGNTHPTSFSDISDKFAWVFDEGKLTSIKIWDMQKGYLGLNWENLLDGQFQALVQGSSQFIEVTGTSPADRLPAIARAVAGLWKLCPEALMIRNAVKAEQAEHTELSVEDVKAMDLPTRIGKELEGTSMHGVWVQYLARVER